MIPSSVSKFHRVAEQPARKPREGQEGAPGEVANRRRQGPRGTKSPAVRSSRGPRPSCPPAPQGRRRTEKRAALQPPAHLLHPHRREGSLPRLLSDFHHDSAQSQTGWLGREDSNSGMSAHYMRGGQHLRPFHCCCSRRPVCSDHFRCALAARVHLEQGRMGVSAVLGSDSVRHRPARRRTVFGRP
jgi:hypothetical protein